MTTTDEGGTTAMVDGEDEMVMTAMMMAETGRWVQDNCRRYASQYNKDLSTFSEDVDNDQSRSR